MDWYVTRGDAATVTALRHQVSDYLSRHAEPGSDVDDAELIFQELLVNTQRHTDGPAWVRLTWLEEQPDVTIWDLGPGFELTPDAAQQAVAAPEIDMTDTGRSPYDMEHRDLPELNGVEELSEGGRGLFLVSHLAERLEVAARSGGGSCVSVRLPVKRAPARDVKASRPPVDALPDLDEAMATGGFGRETFLRALVVQLGQAVERSGDPDTAEQVVADVGLAVGGQMEAEYRLAKDVVSRLSREQMAECFVRLKHAIDGRFYIIEIDEDRIVLGNERCPFGNAVRKAPALCRMTSAVFGGIAANNHEEGAAVVLEERIAVGDPGCRVVVHLGLPPAEQRRFAHRYPAPPASPA